MASKENLKRVFEHLDYSLYKIYVQNLYIIHKLYHYILLLLSNHCYDL